MTSKPAIKEQTRSKVVDKLAEVLAGASDSGVDPELARELATEVEAEMKKTYSKVDKDYTAKGRSLVFNLTKNSELRTHVLERQITAAKLVSANAKELAPDQIKMQRAQSIDRYFATRQLGNSSERVVGWQAGTSGKLERSHKYENENEASADALPQLSGAAEGSAEAPEHDGKSTDARSGGARARPVTQSQFVRRLATAKLALVGLADATSGAGIELSGDPTEDAERVAMAMTSVREMAQAIS
tara:strand:+ start:3115 stop:3846 length:732 start_codon:yes stop_codon:yes gene_type:complete